MRQLGTKQIMLNALNSRVVIPAFNIPYLPMMKPVVEALVETDAFGLIQVARLEWIKFRSGSLAAVRDEYETCRSPVHTRLHLDHVPVIDEDNLRVDFEAVLAEAIELGYESVMVDGSRLSLDENIAVSRRAASMAHDAGIPVEAELGAVMGHEAGPLPPYNELFETGKGFTDPDEAKRFVEETGVDWLSVAIGNIHGAISAARKEKKIEARLNIERLDRIRSLTAIPLVLHGGTGIRVDMLREAFDHGIAKINIATAIRQPYEAYAGESVEKAQEQVRLTTVELITNELRIAGRAGTVNPGVEGE